MRSRSARPVLIAAAVLTASAVAAIQPTASTAPASRPAVSRPTTPAVLLGATRTPIKHVVVIIGENHSFDSLFATYTPPRRQQIWNLLSEGIVNADGTPGPNFQKAAQLTASDTGAYTLTPPITGQYQTLPQPNTTYVATGCDGLPANSPDTRFPAALPNGPFQITKYVPYYDNHAEYTGGCEFTGAFVGDPIHRFYQMWQQSAAYHMQLNTWVANTAGDDNVLRRHWVVVCAHRRSAAPRKVVG